MAAPPRPALRILETTLVHPSSPAPPETSLPLTFFDVFWLPFPPVQRVLFYRFAPANAANVSAVLPNLRRALSHAMRIFFPLAGRLRLAPGGTANNRYEVHYRPGHDAVAFTVAEYGDRDVDGLTSGDDPREVSELAPLAPPLPEGGAVLALQATILRGSGLALGVSVHHAACDGAASTHFLHTWAAAAGSAQLPPPPVIDRTLISDPRGLYDVFCPKAAPPTNKTDKMPAVDIDGNLLTTFVLSRDHLLRVKDMVSAEAAARCVATPPSCSSLVAALGLLWSCYERAKPTGDGDSVGGGQTFLLFPVDHRSRMNPALPATYLGNCIGPALATAPKSALAAGGATGLWTACAAAAAAVEDAVVSIGTESMLQWGLHIGEAIATGGGLLTVAASPRFRVYDLDFGFGRPAKVDVVSVAKTGAIAVAESRTDAGGIEVGVALPPGRMNAFQKCFADAVAGLVVVPGAL